MSTNANFTDLIFEQARALNAATQAGYDAGARVGFAAGVASEQLRTKALRDAVTAILPTLDAVAEFYRHAYASAEYRGLRDGIKALRAALEEQS